MISGSRRSLRIICSDIVMGSRCVINMILKEGTSESRNGRGKKMNIELGRVDVLGADAVGQPGQRRFCLFARSWSGSAVMWMEKEQLNRLSLTLDQAMAQLSEGQVLRTEAQAGNL